MTLLMKNIFSLLMYSCFTFQAIIALLAWHLEQAELASFVNLCVCLMLEHLATPPHNVAIVLDHIHDVLSKERTFTTPNARSNFYAQFIAFVIEICGDQKLDCLVFLFLKLLQTFLQYYLIVNFVLWLIKN
jgi:hypothetical protein